MRRRLLIALLCLAARTYAGDMLRAGQPFPSWQLIDHTGATVTSASLAGKKYLLWFFPKAMTPGCTVEGDGLRDNFSAFEKEGVEVLGISFDDPKANAQFVREQQFPFRLLSDTDHQLAVAVGASSGGQAVARRISYLVGADGKVLRAYDAVVPGSHATQVLNDLQLH